MGAWTGRGGGGRGRTSARIDDWPGSDSPPPSRAGMAWHGMAERTATAAATDRRKPRPRAASFFRRAHGKSYRLCGVGRGDADVQPSPCPSIRPASQPQQQLDRAQLLPAALAAAPSRVGQGSSHHPHPHPPPNRVIVLSLSHHFIYLSDLISYLLPPLLLLASSSLSLLSVFCLPPARPCPWRRARSSCPASCFSSEKAAP